MVVVAVVVIIVVVLTDFVRDAIVDCCRSAIVRCMLCHAGSDIVKGCSGCCGDCRVLAVMVR